MDDPSMHTITLEEHFATPEFFDGPARFVKERAEKIGGRYAQVVDRLCDVGVKRLAEMDSAGIDMQVLSLSAPGANRWTQPRPSRWRAIPTITSQRPSTSIQRVLRASLPYRLEHL